MYDGICEIRAMLASEVKAVAGGCSSYGECIKLGNYAVSGRYEHSS